MTKADIRRCFGRLRDGLAPDSRTEVPEEKPARGLLVDFTAPE